MEDLRVAFIIHPLNRSHLLRVKHKMVNLCSSFSLVIRSSPTRVLTLSFATKEKRLLCDVMLCPLLPDRMIKDEASATSRILQLIEVARSGGARLVGLGGFTSIVGNGGLDVARRSPLPLTSGNTYTAATVVRSVILAGKKSKIDFSNSCIAIVGATGDIGSACAKGLSKLFGRVILTARNDERLESLADLLQCEGSRVCIEKRASKAAANADVLVTVTSALTTLIETKDLKRKAIVCDVSYPANIAKEVQKERPDVVVFEGGIVSSKEFVSQVDSKSPFWEFNPRGAMHACFVETLLLALEERYVTYSIGRGCISSERMDEIGIIAEKYGFHPVLLWNDIALSDWDNSGLVPSNMNFDSL